MHHHDESSSDDDLAMARRKRRLMSERKEISLKSEHRSSRLRNEQEPRLLDVEIAIPSYHPDLMPEDKLQVITSS